MLESNLFQIAEESTWEDLGNGVFRQICGYNDQIMLVKARFETDAIGVLHEHYHSQVTYVDSGAFEMSIGDDKKVIRQGDSCYMPPHVIHGCTCLEAGTLIDIFSPHREDFLDKG